MKKVKIISGFDPKEYAGDFVREVPIDLIDEPRRGYRSPKRVHYYAKLLKAGKTPPPIELVKIISVDGRPLKRPFTIGNGEHRYGAAVLAGRQTIMAVIAGTDEDGPFDEVEYATESESAESERKIKIVGYVVVNEPEAIAALDADEAEAIAALDAEDEAEAIAAVDAEEEAEAIATDGRRKVDWMDSV